jgi:hypothetical protein
VAGHGTHNVVRDSSGGCEAEKRGKDKKRVKRAGTALSRDVSPFRNIRELGLTSSRSI